VQLQVVCHRLGTLCHPKTKLITIELVERYSKCRQCVSVIYEKTIAAPSRGGMGDGSRQRGLARWLKGKIQVFSPKYWRVRRNQISLYLLGGLKRWFERN